MLSSGALAAVLVLSAHCVPTDHRDARSPLLSAAALTPSSAAAAAALASSSPGAPPRVPPPPPAIKHAQPPSRPQIMAYYPDWVTADFPPEMIDFDRIDWIDYAFSVADDKYNLNWDGTDTGDQMLARLVSAAHANRKKVKVSVGGWTGSRYFSPATSTDANRRKLAANILSLYNQYHLDGIDIDWEYPAQQGDPANVVDPQTDTANYLAFLKLLRKTLPPDAKITAAAMTVPWAGPDGNPLADMSQFATALDWVLIMNYDTWGSSSKPGPNAILTDACRNSTQPNANAVAAVQIWTKAGFPANQIVLGVPSYGYISKSSATKLRTRAAQDRDLHAKTAVTDSDTTRSRTRRTVAKRAPSPAPNLGPLFGFGGDLGFLGSAFDSLVAGTSSLVDELIPGLMVKSKAKAQGEAQSDDSAGDDLGGGDSGSPDSDSDSDSDSGSDDGDADNGDTNDGEDGVQAETFQNGVLLVTNEEGGTDNGQIQFHGLLRQGALRFLPSPDASSSQPSFSSSPPSANNPPHQIPNQFGASGGFTRRWDSCSLTPFLANGKQVVTYDDPQSLEMKADWARSVGLLGVNMFDVHGDSDHWDLVDAVRRGLQVG